MIHEYSEVQPYNRKTTCDISETALRRWMAQTEIDEGHGPAGALTTEERQELTRLRRELRQVTLERDFLKKAAAFFARENS